MIRTVSIAALAAAALTASVVPGQAQVTSFQNFAVQPLSIAGASRVDVGSLVQRDGLGADKTGLSLAQRAQLRAVLSDNSMSEAARRNRIRVILGRD